MTSEGEHKELFYCIGYLAKVTEAQAREIKTLTAEVGKLNAVATDRIEKARGRSMQSDWYNRDEVSEILDIIEGKD